MVDNSPSYADLYAQMQSDSASAPAGVQPPPRPEGAGPTPTNPLAPAKPGTAPSYLDLYHQMQGEAGANVNAAQGIPQAAAITATQHGPAAKVDPAVGMLVPDQVKSQAADAAAETALQHPSVNSFAKTSVANVAVTKPDWEAMAKIADKTTALQRVNQGFRNYLNFPGEMLSQFTDQTLPAETRAFARMMIARKNGDFLGEEMSRWTGEAEALLSPFSAALEPIVRPIAAGLNQIKDDGPILKGPDGKPLRGPTGEFLHGPGHLLTPEQQAEHAEQGASFLAGFLPFAEPKVWESLGKGAGEAAAGAEHIPGGPGAPPHETVNGGPAFVHPTTGVQLTPGGFVADAHGNPASFASAREAGAFRAQHLGDVPGEFLPIHYTNITEGIDTWGIQRTPGSEENWEPSVARPTMTPEQNPEPFKAQNEHAVKSTEELQEMLGQLSFHGQVPSVTEEFLQKHTSAGDFNVYVDPNTVLELYQQGHQPFPDFGYQLGQALYSGRPMAMPYSSYLVGTAGKPFAADLNATTKFDQEGISQKEAEEKFGPMDEDLRQKQEIEAEPGFEGERMATMFRMQHGDPEHTAQITVKELLQNSFDAVREAMGKLGIAGKITFKLDSGNRVISINDNGVGMSPRVLAGPFTKIAGSQKDIDHPGGGFGVAKLVTLYGNGKVHVYTMTPDGQLSVMHTSGPELMQSLGGGPKPKINTLARHEIPEVSYDQVPFGQRSMDWETIRELFPDGQGTHIEIELPEHYNNPMTGKEVYIPFPHEATDLKALVHSPLFHPIDVRLQNTWQHEAKSVKNIGSTFNASDYNVLPQIHFPWGTARVYIGKVPLKHPDYEGELHFLSNGVYQFSERLKIPNSGGKQIPFRIYVDLVPNGGPDKPGYPFIFNRQALTEAAKQDWRRIEEYIQAIYGMEALKLEAKEYHNIHYLDGNGQFGPPIEMKPELPPTNTLGHAIGEDDKVEVRHGRLFINGEEMPEFDVDELKKAMPSSNELKVAQDKVNANAVMVHDNTKLDPAGFGHNSGAQITDHMMMLFGDRFGEFLQFTGNQMIELRNQVAQLMGWDGLTSEGVGISFDKGYRGVSIRVPFSALFVNPLLPRADNPIEQAFGIINTMLHEFVHHKIRDHYDSFSSTFQEIQDRLAASGLQGGWDFQQFQLEFVGGLQHYTDIITKGKEIFASGHLSNAAESIPNGQLEVSNGEPSGLGGRAGHGSDSRQLSEAEGPDGENGEGGGRGRQRTSVPGEGADGIEQLARLNADIARARLNIRNALDRAERDLGLKDLFVSPKGPFTKSQLNFYDQKIREWKEEVEQKLIGKVVRDFYKTQAPEWRAEVDQQTAQALQELAQDHSLQAYSALTRNKGVLGEPLVHTKLDANDPLVAQVSKLLGLPDTMFRPKGGARAVDIANIYGMNSGQELLQKLTDTKLRIGDASFETFLRQESKRIGENRAREKLGFDISPGNLIDQAYESVAVPEIEDLLAKSLVELSNQIGRRINKADVRELAREQFEKLGAKEAANPREAEQAIKSNGELAMKHLEKGEFGPAFNARWQQLLNFYLLREAWGFRKQQASGIRLLRQWGRKKVVGSMDPTVGAILQQVAQQLGYGSKRDAAELARFLEQAKAAGKPSTVEELVQAANDAGMDIEPADIVGENSATVETWRAMMNMLRALGKYGAELNEIKVGRETWEMSALANAVQTNATEVGRKYTPQQLVDARDTAFKRNVIRLKSIIDGNIRPEVPLHFVDGDDQGPLMNSIVNPLQEANFHEVDLTDSWIKAVRGSVSDAYLRATENRIDAPELMNFSTAVGPLRIIKTEGNRRMALLHLGTESGRKRLLEGFGWGEEQEKWLVDSITPEDEKYLRTVWDQGDKLFGEADAMYMRHRGYGLEKDEARAIELKDGRTLPGGHVRIYYDSTLRTYGTMDKPDDGPHAGNPLDESTPARAMPGNLYSLKRRGHGPIDLDPKMLGVGVQEMIHDISFREAIARAQKAVNDPRVKAALGEVLGPTWWNSWNTWLTYVAKSGLVFSDPATKDMAQLVRDFSSNLVFARVGFNISSMMRHTGVGGFHMLREVGVDPGVMARASRDLSLDREATQRFIYSKSGQVRTLLWNLDSNLRDAVVKDAVSGRAMRGYRQAAFFMFALSKRLEAEYTWLCVYRHEMRQHGNDEKAVNSANKSVRDTQGAGSPVDTPAFMRHADSVQGEIARLFMSLLMGFRNTTPNRLWTAVKLFGQGKWGKALSLFAAYGFAAAVWVTAYDTLIGGGDPHAASKGDVFKEELGWAFLDQNLGGFIGINKVLQLAHYTDDSEFTRIADDAHKMAQGADMTEKMGMDLAKGFAGVFGLFTDSMVNLVFELNDVVNASGDQLHTIVDRGLLGREGKEGATAEPSMPKVPRAPREDSGKSGQR